MLPEVKISGLKQQKRGKQGWPGTEKHMGSIGVKVPDSETTEEREGRLAGCRERYRELSREGNKLKRLLQSVSLSYIQKVSISAGTIECRQSSSTAQKETRDF